MKLTINQRYLIGLFIIITIIVSLVYGLTDSKVDVNFFLWIGALFTLFFAIYILSILFNVPINNEDVLNMGNIKFVRTKLGDGVFIHKKDNDASKSIRAELWTSADLRRIAHYMDNNPECKETKCN